MMGGSSVESATPLRIDQAGERRLRWARALAVVVALGGLAALIAVQLFGLFVPPWLHVAPVAALGFVAVGVHLLLFAYAGSVHPRTLGVAARLLAVIVSALGVGGLLWPGGMHGRTAICFVMLGLAFLLGHVASIRARAIPQYLLIAVFAIAYLGVLDQFYRTAIPRGASAGVMPWMSAALMLATSIAYLLAGPSRGILSVLANRGAAGTMARALLPLALVLVPFMDWWQARASFNWGIEGVAFVGLVNVAVLLAFIWWIGTSLHRAALAKQSAESHVETSEERLRLALAAAGGGVWDWDLENDRAWWSPEMYRMWRVDPQLQMQQQNSLDVIDPRDRERVTRGIATAIAEHVVYESEFRIHDDVRECWMISRGRVHYDAAGKAVRLIGITVDITDRKRMELELRQSNTALARSNRELERFAHVASHDLQTPLRSIVGFAELLQVRCPEQLGAEARGWLDRIVASARQLQAIVHDLLQYARIDTQTRPFAPVSLQTTLEHCQVLLDSRIRESAAVIESDDLPTVQGDASQLTQLWLNLLDNAIKYRGVEPPLIRIGVTAGQECWEFAVSDNGIGIDERFSERIFEMFERLHGQNDYPGTGVGLAICRRVIQRHGGRIWVESRPGGGSTFRFTLPRIESGNAT